uniref:Uncharacterized protein n=1 Tax=Rhizophora mucronata TaxID=61149 RepID=A0A2P2QX98_RHIMU
MTKFCFLELSRQPSIARIECLWLPCFAKEAALRLFGYYNKPPSFWIRRQ